MILAKNHFDIDLPNGWKDRTVHTFMGPDESGVQHILTLVIDRDVSNIELSEFARERINAVVDSMPGIEVLKDEEKTLSDGRAVHEFIYKWAPVNGKVIFQKQIYMLIDEVGYTFSANFSEKTIEAIGSDVEQIISSFQPAGAGQS